MNVLLFGASGMVGRGALLECLKSDRVRSVLVVGRTSCGVADPKVREIVHGDFFDFSPIRNEFAGVDACFFCLGVSSAGLSEADYHHLTYDLTLAAAKSISEVNTRLAFCYVSGTGTDSTERGRTMWARVKGKTENALLRMPFKAAFMFRPGFIQPLDGIRSKTRLYQSLYSVVWPLYPLLRRVFPRYVTNTRNLGRAMIQVAAAGYSKPILESVDINALAESATAPR
jgi:uncharacterized protein YbjT (DUF2867 family)